MPLIEQMQARLDWITRHSSISMTQVLMQQLKPLVVEQLKSSTPSKRLCELLVFDLSYCLQRNQKWRELGVFKDIVADFVAGNYALSRIDAESLVERINGEYRTLYPTNDLHPVNEKDFLRFLYFYGKFSRQSEDSDLGLGDQIFARISAADAMVNKLESDAQPDQAAFLPEIDAKLVDLIIDLHDELRKDTNIEDNYRLQFIIAQNEPAHKVLLHQFGLERLWQLMLTVGTMRTVTTERLMRDLMLTEANELTQVLEILCAADLLYKTDRSEKALKQSWSLSKSGYSLSAARFARLFNCDSIEFSSISNLAMSYQAAVIDRLNGDQLDRLTQQYLTSAKGIAGESVENLLDGLNKHLTLDVAIKSAVQILQTPSFSIVARKRALKFLSPHLDRQDIRLVLKSVAVSDSSQALQDLAIEGLAGFERPIADDSRSSTI